MNIKKSIYHRVEHLVMQNSFRDAAHRNNLSLVELSGVTLEMIEVLETVKNYRKQSNILLDIGAHIGLFSKTANLLLGFEKVICFEPNLAHIPLIEENNKDSNIEIENIALSDHDGESTYFLHEDSSMNSIVETDDAILHTNFPYDDPRLMEKTAVRTMKLDQYISQRKDFVDSKFFIKIDTQGNELNILQQGISTLERTEICLVEHMFLSPYHSDYQFYDLIDFMKGMNFECQGPLTLKKRPNKKISAVDFLFTRHLTN